MKLYSKTYPKLQGTSTIETGKCIHTENGETEF